MAQTIKKLTKNNYILIYRKDKLWYIEENIESYNDYQEMINFINYQKKLHGKKFKYKIYELKERN